MSGEVLKKRRAVLVLGVLAILSLSMVGGAFTHAAFTSQSSNPSNTFQAAASFGPACPSSAPSITWLSGLEHGMSTTAGGGIWNLSTGTGAALDTTVKRNGAYSLKLSPAGAALYRARIYSVTPTTTDWVVRFAIRLESLPAADSELAGLTTLATTTPPYFSVKYKAGSQKFAIGFPGQSVESSTTVAAGTWYTIELKYSVGSNPHTADWRINGQSQPSASYAAAATAIYSIHWGSSAAATYTANYDDWMLSQDASQYPLGDGKVLALTPDGAGTSVGAANLQDDDATPIDSTTWQRLDDVPMGTGTDYVTQVTASGTSYAETTLADTTETCIRAVGGRVVFDPLNTNQANHGKTAIVDGSTERTVYDGDMAANNTLMNPKFAVIEPAAGAWTPSTVNALRARIGYSTDATPQPRWHSLMLEYDVPQ